MSAPATTTIPASGDETTDLSSQYDTPLGLAHTTMQALKDRIKLHYDLASDYYLNLWGEHIHHGYWPTASSKATDSKETAQLNLIRLLLSISTLLPEGEQGDGDDDDGGADSESSSHATTTTAAGTTISPTAPISRTTTTTTASTTTAATADQRPPPPPPRILDVGCGVGGTTRYLASALGAAVTGITISGKQVQIATRLSKAAVAASPPSAATPAATTTTAAAAAVDGHAEGVKGGSREGGEEADDDDDDDDEGSIPLGDKGGRVRFVELDAEKMGEYFASSSENDAGKSGGFDVVWISEALSHFPNKALFFRNAHRLLRPGGKLVLADWFRAEELGEGVFEADIKPIEDGMLLPPLCTQQEYVNLATAAGLEVLGGPKDISQDVSKTWDISWSLVQNPSLWAFAFSQGRDGIAFLQAFRAMRRGYANGSFRYAVMSFVKP